MWTTLTRSDVAALRWDVAPEPVIGPPFGSPVIADPTFLPPAETPDGGWHLWAHSLRGLHAYQSPDGLSWERGSTLTHNALRPHISTLAGSAVPFRLCYEKTRLFVPFGLPWRSWLESRSSADLRSWTAPTVLLRPSLDWHKSGKDESVSNPCLVPLGAGRWRLYYSAGVTLLPDCGFSEPTYIGVAESDSPDGPFTPMAKPLLGPYDGVANHAAGAMKVFRVADGWIGFQNAITWDGRHTASAIWLLGSDDGLLWNVLGDQPLIAPTGSGWRSDYVYALDIRPVNDGLRMYFNARQGHHWTRGRERIGYADAI